MTALHEVNGLTVQFATEAGHVTAVRNLNLAIEPGETVAVVGESGSGKSVMSLAITGLLDRATGRVAAGSMLLTARDGRQADLASTTPQVMRRLRGSELAMVFQEPMSSRNPVLRIGEQIAEGLVLHRGMSRHRAMQEAQAMLERVRVPDPARQLRRYPFELSGGMRQRVMIAIAIAIACRPRLLIADEPTTALEVTVQAQVLMLLRGLQTECGMGMLFITHDMGVVARSRTGWW